MKPITIELDEDTFNNLLSPNTKKGYGIINMGGFYKEDVINQRLVDVFLWKDTDDESEELQLIFDNGKEIQITLTDDNKIEIITD